MNRSSLHEEGKGSFDILCVVAFSIKVLKVHKLKISLTSEFLFSASLPPPPFLPPTVKPRIDQRTVPQGIRIKVGQKFTLGPIEFMGEPAPQVAWVVKNTVSDTLHTHTNTLGTHCVPHLPLICARAVSFCHVITPILAWDWKFSGEHG